MAQYLGNAFSLAMLSTFPSAIKVEEVGIENIPDNVESVVSHESTAQVVSRLLKREVPFNRVNISLKRGDVLYVFQVLKRPREGQIFSQAELQEIVQNHLYKILKVKVEL